jgi:FAD/FMN-containing dehydrogenase
MDSDSDTRKLLYHAFPSAVAMQEDGWMVYPSSTREVAGVVSIAVRCGCPVIASPPQEDEPAPAASTPVIRISMEKMTGVAAVSETGMTAEVQAGIAVRNLEIVLNDHGMTSGFVLLPDVDPTLIRFINDETLSESSMLYGRLDRCVLGAEGVLPGGEVFRIRPAPSRGIGPDILGLLLSEHGRLSIVTSVVLRIWRQPRSRRVIAAFFNEPGGAMACAAEIAGAGIRLAAGRIYAPGWPDPAGPAGGSGSNVAVFVLEGEQAVVDTLAVHVDKIVQDRGGEPALPQYHLATKFVKLPKLDSGEETELVSATCDWAAAPDILLEASSRFEESLVAARLSDFFPEGCRISWSVKEAAMGKDLLAGLVDVVRRFGGHLVSRHRLIEGGLPPGMVYDSLMQKKIEQLKETMDPNKIIE